ncbi:MAG: hypothetical protein WDZ41_04130 [Candidatus Babeliales bacterium]
MKKIFTLLLMLPFLHTFMVQPRTTVENQDGYNSIGVYFRALGCARNSRAANLAFLCKNVGFLKPNTSTSYKWKGGQSSKRIYIRVHKGSIYLVKGQKRTTEKSYRFRAKKLKNHLVWKGIAEERGGQIISVSDDFKFEHALSEPPKAPGIP